MTPSLYSARHKADSHGFTIVELLVVIAIIAILAGVTIIAYSGISKRAQTDALLNDLEGAAKQLAIDQTTNSVYPATIADANNGSGLKSSNGTTYQYTVDNTQSPPTFCLTGTNGANVSYFVTNLDNRPAIGACSGDTPGSLTPITNLVVNPSLEANTTNWTMWSGSGGTTTNTRPSGSAYAGSYDGLMTWTHATSAIGGGTTFMGPVPVGSTYTASLWVRSNKAAKLYMILRFINSSGTVLATENTAGVILTANSWTRMSGTTTNTGPAGTVNAQVSVYASGGAGSSNWQVGDTFEYDAAMLTLGPTLYNYADGSSNSWSWTGTANNSTSTGPPQ